MQYKVRCCIVAKTSTALCVSIRNYREFNTFKVDSTPAAWPGDTIMSGLVSLFRGIMSPNSRYVLRPSGKMHFHQRSCHLFSPAILFQTCSFHRPSLDPSIKTT